jgi:hypothetical protein
MAVHEPEVALPTRIDRGWLMRHPGALADEALLRIGNPLRKHRFPRPRPLQFRRLRRRTPLVRAPAI